MRERFLPFGEGVQRQEQKLPAVEVANTVTWVNPEIESPFDLEEGKPSKLGVFFSVNPLEGERVLHLGVDYNHRRTGEVGKFVFKDKKGRLYRDVVLKGVGWVYPKKIGRPSEMEVLSPSSEMAQEVSYRGPQGRRSPRGIRLKVGGEHAAAMSQELLDKGIRTCAILGFTDLHELVDKGEKITVEEARKRGILSPDDEPMVEVIAYGTKDRVQDVVNGTRADKERLMKDVGSLIAQELGRTESLSVSEYMSWFAKTLGSQLRLLHDSGYVHRFLATTDGHNITLDARFADLDSVRSFGPGKTPEGDAEKDFQDSLACISRLWANLQILDPAFDSSDNRDRLLLEFASAYNHHE